MILSAPHSPEFCDWNLYIGRFFFLLYLTEITLWQSVKYLYIFQWKHMVHLDDQIVAQCITISSVTSSAILVFVTYMLGYQDAELDFHICTGKTPHDNIITSGILMTWLKETNKTNFSFQDVANSDPLWSVTKAMLLVLFWITFHIWIYSLKSWVVQTWGRVVTGKTRVVRIPRALSQDFGLDKFEVFQNTKNSIIGAGGTLVTAVLIITLLAPSFIAKSYARNNPNDINHGSGKIWTYVSWITLPIFSYCQLPVVILLNNSKMRRFLNREIKLKLYGEALHDLSQ